MKKEIPAVHVALATAILFWSNNLSYMQWTEGGHKGGTWGYSGDNPGKSDEAPAGLGFLRTDCRNESRA